MVEKRTCDYTGEEIEPGTGIMYVKNNGSVLHFVDSKAEKNYKLGREPRDLEWTAAGRAQKGPSQADETAEDEDLATEEEAVDKDEDEDEATEPAGDEDVAEDESVEGDAEAAAEGDLEDVEDVEGGKEESEAEQ